MWARTILGMSILTLPLKPSLGRFGYLRPGALKTQFPGKKPQWGKIFPCVRKATGLRARYPFLFGVCCVSALVSPSSRVLRSGPVRFFGQKWKDRNRNRSISSEICLKTGPDHGGPFFAVFCGFLRSLDRFGTGLPQDQFKPVITGHRPVITGHLHLELPK